MQWFRLLPIGRYMEARSFLHDSDPRSKLIFAAVYLSLIASSSDITSLFFFGFVTLVLVFVSRVPFAYLWHGLRGLLPLLLAFAIYHLWLNDNGEVSCSWGGIAIHNEGIKNALIVPSKLVFLIITAAVLSLTTPPAKLADGLETIMRPLSFIRFPVHEFVFIASVAFRFIPIFIDEADAILKAQKIRSTGIEGSFVRIKIHLLSQLLFALFVSAFRRAEQLALAMDARCYIAENRMRTSRLRFGWRDWIVIISALILLLIPYFEHFRAISN
ncbi:energy-coupling factor transporter transmembrane component T family protein [Paenibacillus piri]|uniref:Energy-coupling factor transporter transmembrane protein EcfT n=1 Tax=Paenibacillus piri TaxID=2547395 RepID=A0A4R5K8E4_9BACL|nr:energy-coupling factor transporter transmembrane component T [Paenibacillus piri]TDF90095.1 energy-coupling factor transporter transmembrane protein EcfT [Paenibacillus piri]